MLQRCFTPAEAVYGFFANGGTSCYVVGLLTPDQTVTEAALAGDAEKRAGLGGLERPDRRERLRPPIDRASRQVRACSTGHACRL
ncbi:hypothetical protein ACGFOU_36245 [Streptomyces sp. NPDC048595]|uniref:hypothetical protein n=1 Tax=Streptomyces sp. NPDC048595 TaxID=3365576 RepID=UPI003713E306